MIRDDNPDHNKHDEDTNGQRNRSFRVFLGFPHFRAWGRSRSGKLSSRLDRRIWHGASEAVEWHPLG